MVSARAASAPADEPQQAKPVRVTVDLSPQDYDALRDWAHFARMSHSAVLRALLRLLTSSEDVAEAVRNHSTEGDRT
jgi:hypothetical protein